MHGLLTEEEHDSVNRTVLHYTDFMLTQSRACLPVHSRIGAHLEDNAEAIRAFSALMVLGGTARYAQTHGIGLLRRNAKKKTDPSIILKQTPVTPEQ